MEHLPSTYNLYLCIAKKKRDGLCHQRTKNQAGHRTQLDFAKKRTLRIVHLRSCYLKSQHQLTQFCLHYPPLFQIATFIKGFYFFNQIQHL